MGTLFIHHFNPAFSPKQRTEQDTISQIVLQLHSAFTPIFTFNTNNVDLQKKIISLKIETKDLVQLLNHIQNVEEGEGIYWNMQRILYCRRNSL